MSRIPKWQPKGIPLDTHTAINTEWGRYSSNFLPRVQEDLDLDAATGNLKGEHLWGLCQDCYPLLQQHRLQVALRSQCRLTCAVSAVDVALCVLMCAQASCWLRS